MFIIFTVLAGVVYTLIAVMFGGYNPTLKDLRNMGPGTINHERTTLSSVPSLSSSVAIVAASTSWVRWTQEALFIKEIETYPRTEAITQLIDTFDYDMKFYPLDLSMVFILGFSARVLA